jgi:hypothetical protein
MVTSFSQYSAVATSNQKRSNCHFFYGQPHPFCWVTSWQISLADAIPKNVVALEPHVRFEGGRYVSMRPPGS